MTEEKQREYNINELLEEKKQLEEREAELRQGLQQEQTLFRKESIIDYTNREASRDFIPREKKSLSEFCQEYNGIVDRLSKVKRAIARFNVEKLQGMLNERESTRSKMTYIKRILEILPRDTQHGRNVTRKGKEGQTEEVQEVMLEPMFKVEEVQALKDQLAAQERRLNTEIQKMNLNATVTLE